MLYNCNTHDSLKSVISRDLKRRDRGNSIEVYNAIHDALVLRTGIPVIHQSAASQNKPVLVPFLSRETNVLSDARETLRTLFSLQRAKRTLFNPCFINQPFLIFSKSSAGRSTLSSEVGEYLLPEISNPQPSGSPLICTRHTLCN